MHPAETIESIATPMAAVLLGQYKFSGRLLFQAGTKRPLPIVEVKLRIDGYQIHVGFVVCIDGPDIAPITHALAVQVTEIIYHLAYGCRIKRRAGRMSMSRFFLESGDTIIAVHFDDSEAGGLLGRRLNGRDGDICPLARRRSPDTSSDVCASSEESPRRIHSTHRRASSNPRECSA